MVVRRFSPYGSYRKGIIKYIFPTNKSDEIDLKYTNVDKDWAHIYPTAFLDDAGSYYQSTSPNTYLNMTFKKYLFLTHFAISLPGVYSGKEKEICYQKSIDIIGCKDESCVPIISLDNLETYKASEIVLTAINPGTFNAVHIYMVACTCSFNTLQRFEIFGYLCDTREECKWKNINRLNTCKVNYHSKTNILFVMILISK